MSDPDPPREGNPTTPRLRGRWIVAMVLVWPVLIFLLFVALTR